MREGTEIFPPREALHSLGEFSHLQPLFSSSSFVESNVNCVYSERERERERERELVGPVPMRNSSKGRGRRRIFFLLLEQPVSLLCRRRDEHSGDREREREIERERGKRARWLDQSLMIDWWLEPGIARCRPRPRGLFIVSNLQTAKFARCCLAVSD